MGDFDPPSGPPRRRRAVDPAAAAAALGETPNPQPPTPPREAAAADSGAPSQPRPSAAPRGDNLEALASEVVPPRPRRDTPLQGSAPAAPRDDRDRDAERSRSRGDDRPPRRWEQSERGPRDDRPPREEATWRVAGTEGALTLSQLRSKIVRGEVAADVQVWRPGLAGWQAVAATDELRASLPPPLPPAPAQTPPPAAQPAAPAPHQLIQRRCGNCAEIYRIGAGRCGNCGNLLPQ